MTSQVAVTNFSGIAVASDTFISMTTDDGVKTMGNSQKIFEIGPAHKVLILHSGNVYINQISHWLQINEWMITQTIPHATLQAYIDAYISWSNSSKQLHMAETEEGCMNACFCCNVQSQHLSFRYRIRIADTRKFSN